MNGIIVILGSPNDEQGNLSEIAMGRLELGLAEYRNREGYKILCTGGFGEHFNTTERPHAEYAIRHLLEKGIPEKDVLEIAESRNTVEDALLSKPIIEKFHARSLIIVSSNFHMQRVEHIFQQVFDGYDLTFSGAKTEFPAERLRTLRKHEKKELEKLRKMGLHGLSI